MHLLVGFIIAVVVFIYFFFSLSARGLPVLVIKRCYGQFRFGKVCPRKCRTLERVLPIQLRYGVVCFVVLIRKGGHV